MGLTPGELWDDSRHKTRGFIFSRPSSPALGPTQPFTQGIHWAFPWGS